MEKTDILSLSKEELEEKILAMGEKKFRAGQIYDWLHINKVEEFSKMTNLSAQRKTRRYFLDKLTKNSKKACI